MQLVLRRVLAVIVALGLPAMAIGVVFLGSDTSDEYKNLVEKAPRQVATVVEVREHFLGPTVYVVESTGNRFTLGHSEALDTLEVHPGDTVAYVIDTVDPLWTVGVGDPEYWEPNLARDVFLPVAIIGFSLIFALFVIDWLLPAGFERQKKTDRNIRGRRSAEKPTD